MACTPAAMPYSMNGSHLRASFASMKAVGSKLRIVPAKRVENALTSYWSIGVIPLTPSRTFAQPSATVLPHGEIRPRPVTTTRRFDTVDAWSSEGMGDAAVRTDAAD